MIVLSVHSYNGVPSAGGPSASFDEIGGTIGRAESNQLVLPDPERTISRVHARVLFRASGYLIVDNGSNPISVNGTPVGAGRECPLRPGDKVEIGGYVLAVAAGSAARNGDTFADLFGDAPLGLATPAAPPAWPPRPAAPVPAAAAWPPAPLARATSPVARAASPVARATPPAARAATPAAGPIPDDWDPFAPDTASPGYVAPHDTLLDIPLVAGPGPATAGALPSGGGDTLDDLFGLAGAPAGADPLGAAPAQMLGQPNMAASADPLRSLAAGASAPAASVSDHASELNTPMPLPPAARGPAAQPRGAVFSWDDPPRDGRLVTLPEPHRAPPAPDDTYLGETAVVAPPARPPMPSAPIPPMPPMPPPAMSPRMARPQPVPAAPPAAGPAGASAGGDALLKAFLDGLGSPSVRLRALTPQTMQLIGELLREATRGAVELLVARAALKRELRAEMTMIVARENNPLKFSPTVDVALQHLLGERTPGFMAPAPALRDAFDDLRAHQMGVMAGMRAALEGVLARFDPAQLEGKLTRRTALDSLIPAARKARLWELFQELFAQLQHEAQDDFDELFGKAFLRAYEEQLARLQGGER